MLNIFSITYIVYFHLWWWISDHTVIKDKSCLISKRIPMKNGAQHWTVILKLYGSIWKTKLRGRGVKIPFSAHVHNMGSYQSKSLFTDCKKHFSSECWMRCSLKLILTFSPFPAKCHPEITSQDCQAIMCESANCRKDLKESIKSITLDFCFIEKSQ